MHARTARRARKGLLQTIGCFEIGETIYQLADCLLHKMRLKC